MRCGKVDRLLEAFIAGELGERKERLVREHLAGCPACRLKAALCERIDAALGENELASAPVGAVEKLMSRIRGEKATRRESAVAASCARMHLVLEISAAAAVLFSLLDIFGLVDVHQQAVGPVRLATDLVTLASSALAGILTGLIPALGDAPAGLVPAIAYALLAAAALLFILAGVDLVLAGRTRRKFFHSAG